ncbi:MAG: peptidoglycan-associated lipoprotein Pal [Rhodobacteraceae bacterium]|nr:peptidoglycan-associated lipoprotein Pal [Alphaproteobacteria bacterium]MBT8475816.1 peptidoglycan-associated lipoprotein Pal [Alphaproteobacteria bacterium]NNF70985.1 peptidoglycan-associated lipoprotein Pal [Paracoccaceae bacterium]NNK68481.1 peptidoglycan-associated lipoprotein Pal [Paracoccaceae bacterium]
MIHLRKALLLTAIVALGACSTNAGRFGAGGPGAGGSLGAGGLGSISDPTSVAYFQATVGDRVLFEVDQATLTSTAQATLSEQALFLMSNGEYTAIIEGHADERGTREYNLALGARRASAVQDYLVSQGVAPNRLRTVTYGKERPLEVCSDEACYSQNRRGVTVLTAGLGS